MVIAVRTWEIAKLLLQSCHSKNDVVEVVATLRNPQAIEEVCSLLAGFSDSPNPVDGYQVNVPSVSVIKSNTPISKIARLAGGNDEFGSTTDSVSATAEQLEATFRSARMTNKQVEQWVADHFDVTAVLGKRSLRDYLRKVLIDADLSLRNRILAWAQQLVSDGTQPSSDLKKYWDELDKRFQAAE